MKLRYFSAQPVPQNYTPPADMHVVHYGQPDQTTVTQTTVTTTNVDPNMNVNGGSVSMSMGGANVNMNVNGGNMGGTTISQTSTTTTTSSSSNMGGYTQQQSAPAGCQYPMDWGNFKSAKETINQSSFEDTKLSSAKAILGSNCVSTDQVIEICKLFSFEQSKLDFAKFAYSKTTDPGNYFKVGNVFSFDDSKAQLNNFISNGGR